MSITFKTPTEIADQYLQHLKALKPTVNISQTDSDWWVRSRVVGGVLAGVYADQRKIADDAFPQSARREALERHLALYFNGGFNPATPSQGTALFSGVIGTVLPAGTELLYEPSGNTYTTQVTTTLSAATGLVAVQSVVNGQNQNLLQNAPLLFTSPPGGINAQASAFTALSDGRNDESNEEAAQRILNRLRAPPSGGTANDYRTWAQEADPSVTDVNVVRYLYGLGTVGVVIAAGTTDIDAAVDAGVPVVRVPSDALVAEVRDYVNAKKPLTDCAFYLKPVETPVDVSIRVRYSIGSGATIPAGQTLTQEELIRREIKRAIYKTPPGGRRFGGSGFVVASEIEEQIDTALSDTPYTVGAVAQVVADRQVLDLTASSINRLITELEIAVPGTITVLSF